MIPTLSIMWENLKDESYWSACIVISTQAWNHQPESSPSHSTIPITKTAEHWNNCYMAYVSFWKLKTKPIKNPTIFYLANISNFTIGIKCQWWLQIFRKSPPNTVWLFFHLNLGMDEITIWKWTISRFKCSQTPLFILLAPSCPTRQPEERDKDLIASAWASNQQRPLGVSFLLRFFLG